MAIADSGPDSDDMIPPELVRELAEWAKLVPVVHPGDAAAECGYRASRQLGDFRGAAI